jgi:serine/threonine protein kinase
MKINNVYIQGQKIRLKPTQAIGKGGEADIYDIGKGIALKLFKQPDHPDYQNLPAQQQLVKERLAEHQYKLRLFPNNLPDQVVKPLELVMDAAGTIILGYTMPLIINAEVLLKYSDRNFRNAGISNQNVIQIFKDLYSTVFEIHKTGVIIGDFNDLNVLVRENKAYLIDADSFSIPTFPCRVFTSRFLDPFLCDSQASQPILIESYTTDSDWYAFNVMLMQCLLFVHPFGGIYKPKQSSQKIPHEARPLHGISIFHPEVKYPKPAIPYQVLPDDLLHYFQQVFDRDQRGIFPKAFLDQLHWQKCHLCGIEHARSTCPNCVQRVPVAKPVTQVLGNVKFNRIFTTEGVILSATVQNGKLWWVYHKNGEFKREKGEVILTGPLDPTLKIRIQGETTFISKQGQLIALKPGKPPTHFAANRFDVNATHCFWTYNGQLLKNGTFGDEYIGDILDKQTHFWVGEKFGFGFYRAGKLHVSFVFDTHRQGINDCVKLPRYSGQLLDATCTFTSDRCWFFWATQEHNQIFHHVAIIHANGSIEAITTQPSNTPWLSNLHGKCAAGNFLLVATDDGIIRVEPENGQILPTKTFPETEPFVNANSQLFLAPQGLYVVNSHQIHQLILS